MKEALWPKPDMSMHRNAWRRARSLFESGSLKSAVNRAYYAIFHAMRAALAYDGIDMKHHSGIISNFRRLYIKTGIVDVKLSLTISELYDLRTSSDYDDFFVITGTEVAEQLDHAADFLCAVEKHLADHYCL